MHVVTYTVNEGISDLLVINTQFEMINAVLINDSYSLSQVKDLVKDFFDKYLISNCSNSSFYSLMLSKLQGLDDREAFKNSLKQAVSCKVQDIIDCIVNLIDEDLFIKGTIRHLCSKSNEQVCLLELAELQEDAICLVRGKNHSRIFRFNKTGREKLVFNLQEIEGYDHEIHYPDQLDDGQVVDILPHIIKSLTKIITTHS
ncbi:hypothetical protein HGB13_02225 [bacterium]|nr:hypothetical protein [bacterium]